MLGWAGRYGWRPFEIIVVNYLACVVLSYFLLGEGILNLTSDIVLGACLLALWGVVGFVAIGLSAQINGVALTSVANKISMIVPALAGFWLFGEKATLSTVAGVIAGGVATLLATPNRQSSLKTSRTRGVALFLFVFLSSGIFDLSLKLAEEHLLVREQFGDFLLVYFVCALCVGVGVGVGWRWRQQPFISRGEALTGILMALPNIGSFYFLLAALEEGMPASVFFPINNVGVILTASVAGALLMGERLSTRQIAGIATGIVGIALVGWG